LNHPALAGAYVQGATFSPDYSDFDDATGTGEVIVVTPGGGTVSTSANSAHGTLCAGIIGARYRPDYPTGVIGLSPGSRIMPLRVISYRKSLIAMAMTWAADHGARVISISKSDVELNGSDPMTNPLAAAISNVTARGVVICAATMNNNVRAIHYPAGHSSVIACGACNHSHDRCHPPDWDDLGLGAGSNYGDSLSVVANGITVPSTDLTDSNGSNSSASPLGDYDFFQGTSSATPQVAALAANLMSRFSALRGSDAASAARMKEILERSAHKVGKATVAGSPDPIGNPTPVGDTLTYSTGRPHGGWEQEMGFGEIDHAKAMQTATELLAAGADNQPPSPPSGLINR
jgi:subtilisin family serine protease